jgi:HK97 family phage portal protein
MGIFSKREVKSCSQLTNVIYGGLFNDASNAAYCRYYEQVAPFATGIDMIIDAAAQITPYLFDKAENQFTKEHEFLDLLAAPNSDKTHNDFVKQTLLNYLVFGNAYIIATGLDPRKPPKELYCVSPRSVSIVESNNDYYPDSYQVTVNDKIDIFKKEENELGVRYYNAQGNELWHIKRQTCKNNSLKGDSIASAIRYDLEQYLQAGIHNAALLKNGFNPNVSIILKDNMTDDDFNSTCESIKKYYHGSENAGKALVSSGIEKIENLGLSAKDMDFLNLRKSSANAIYLRLGVPLALVSPDNMTLANMETSQYLFYDSTVLPLVKKFYTELTVFLGHRYGLEDLELWYDENEIGPNADRKAGIVEKYSKLGIFTINEMRGHLGFEPADGGDAILGQSTSVPVAQDTYTEDEPKPDKKLFMDMMSDKGLTQDELEEIAKQEGL